MLKVAPAPLTSRSTTSFGSIHVGQAFVNLVRCNHKFATTHLRDKTEVSDPKMN